MLTRVVAVAAGSGVAMGLVSAYAASQAAAHGPTMDLWSGIRDVGFPAAAFVMLFVLVRTTMRDHTKAISELRDAIHALCNHCARSDRQ